MKDNIIAIKSYNFALSIVFLSKKLVENKVYVLSRQILKSGTSIGANVEEAIGGISKRDFRAKMSISYKEARETHYWLRLLKDSKDITAEEFNALENELSSILKILFKIIQSSKR
ncbi:MULTISPECIES: four helix bundle protein [Bizionia]|uniref:Four helix bundle protein n=1 Tax=Bizionia algoritergicola TaxID=291187 RepID=A0A5D0QTC2_9FLAO|nr:MULTISPECIES: four helix bundle protein [Bizionia]OBX21260.1 four helix bundle protein [Bizionia sp. APA-3]TYB71678.1 four helix bundle protein [Bizionia algoritergicola]